jgi:O-methyltransferase
VSKHSREGGYTLAASRRTLMKLPKVLRRNRPAEGSDAEQPLLQVSDPADRRIVEAASPYTITGIPRLLSLVDAVRYCVARGIGGAFAECGVWRGGSILAMILTLQDLGCADRDIYLYDTFEGMTEPTEFDVSPVEPPALTTWRQATEANHRPWPAYFEPDAFNEETVRATLVSTGYPAERLHFVRGPVEETIPAAAPERLALLRLDTDWYESTRHELQHLFPLLARGGVLIVDDYGHWEGARRAVDEYFSTEHPPLLLNRIDYTARIAVKD